MHNNWFSKSSAQSEPWIVVTALCCLQEGHSCKIGNTCRVGTLKNQIPKLLKKSLFWLSCTCLQCFWLEKNNWPSYCTSNKFSVPPSKNFNVPTRQIFNTSDYNIDDFDLYDKKPVMQHICITQRHIVLHKYIFWGILDFLQFH